MSSTTPTHGLQLSLALPGKVHEISPRSDAVWKCSKDARDLYHRGPLMHGLASAVGSDDRTKAPGMVILGAGLSTRMGLIGLLEGSKARIPIVGRPVWMHAASAYFDLAQKIAAEIELPNRNEWVLFGAGDHLVPGGFGDALPRDIAQYLGRQRHLFFLSASLGEKSLIPYGAAEQGAWLRRTVTARIKELEGFVPGMQLLHGRLETLRADRTSSASAWPSAFHWNAIGGSAITQVARSLVTSEAIRKYGGSRVPFLYVLSTTAITRLGAFLRGLDARQSSSLDWHNAIVMGVLMETATEFSRQHLETLGRVKAEELYSLLRSLCDESDRQDILRISNQFSEQKRPWWALESPLDLFNHVRETTRPQRTSQGLHQVHLFEGAQTSGGVDVEIVAGNLPPGGVHFVVVVAGHFGSSLRLRLAPPRTDLSGRSNFYPYLVYRGEDAAQQSHSLEIHAQELTVLGATISDDARRCAIVRDLKQHAVSTPLFFPTQRAMLEERLNCWTLGRWERCATTLGDLFAQPV